MNLFIYGLFHKTLNILIDKFYYMMSVICSLLRRYYIIAILLISILLIIISLSFGTIYINIFDINKIDDMQYKILTLRFYRIITAFTVGGALSIAGAGYQAILRNPLAEPYILGISSGAGIGAAVSIVLNFSIHFYFALPVSAFIGSMIVLSVILLSMKSKYKNFNHYNVMMSGIAINTICGSILMLIISFSNTGKLNNITWWLLGSLEFSNLKILLIILTIILICVFIMFLFGKHVNVLCFGNEFAYNLGISSVRLSFIILCISSLVTSFAVAISGMIGFVGFVVPHISRSILGSSDNRIVFPYCFYLGGMFLIFCDIISRIISSSIIPIGVITSLIGGPIFIFIINKKIRNE